MFLFIYVWLTLCLFIYVEFLLLKETEEKYRIQEELLEATSLFRFSL